MHPIDISEKAGVRYLHFGSDWVQGAMRIARPWALELMYTREMMAGLLLRRNGNWPRKALLIGLGTGSVVKFIYRNLPACRMTVVEINPQVEWIARQYFKLPDNSAQLQVVIGEGAEYMLAGNSHFDAIFVDGFDPDGRPGALDTLPFYQACRARLSDNGLLAINMLGRSRGFKANIERLRQAFDRRVIAFPPSDSGNAITFAAAGKPVEATLDELRERAVALKNATGLDLLHTIARLQATKTLPEDRLTL